MTYVCFCLKMLYFIYPADLWTLKSQSTALQLMPEGGLSDSMFPVRDIRPFALRDTSQYFSSTHGDILNSQITKKRHKDGKYVALSGPQKGHTYSLRLETSRPKFNLSWEQMAGHSHSSPHLRAWMTTKALCWSSVTKSVSRWIWKYEIQKWWGSTDTMLS